MRRRIINLIITLAVIVGLVAPAPVLAAVNSSPSAAAADGIRYLGDNQNADGSISGFEASEWTAEAVAAAGQDVGSFAHGGSSLLDFLKADASDTSTPAATVESKIIAMVAAGQDPSDFGGVDYVSLLAAKRTGGQIGDNGDTTKLTDDFFGIIAIDAAHDTSLLPEAQDALDYLLAHQQADGGFSWSAVSCADYCDSDSSDTAAALIALYAASDLGLLPSDTTINLDLKKTSALNYLLTTQQTDGGFGADTASTSSDGYSTTWALMALNFVGSSVDTPAVSARTWLLDDQNSDGGFGGYLGGNSDTYVTANAVLALLGTTWLLNPAPTPIAVKPPHPPSKPVGSGGGSGGSATRTSSSDSDSSDTPAGTGSGSASGDSDTTASDPPAKTDSSKTSKDGSGKVKGASITGLTTPVKKGPDKAGHKSAVYGAAVLILVALIWFMLESRKGHGVKDER